MIGFLKRIFGGGTPQTSADTAADRLRLTLQADRANLPAGLIEEIERAVVEAVSRYCEVTQEGTSVRFGPASGRDPVLVAEMRIQTRERETA